MFVETESLRKRRESDADSLELKNKIVVRAIRNGSMGKINPYSTVFYILDLKTGQVSRIRHTLQDHVSIGSMISVGSLIYIFGKDMSDRTFGDWNYPKSRKGIIHQGASCLDLAKPQFGWKKASKSMDDVEQSIPDCVSFGGKIYFFRGSEYSCICEVFDPELNHWRRIKSPPARDDEHGGKLELTPPVMADYKNNRIIVCFNNISTMYAYYPSKDQWECLVEGFRGWCYDFKQIVCVDGVIYVYLPKSKDMVKAYDIASKKWLKVAVSSDFNDLAASKDEIPLTLRKYHDFFHLGNGLMCLTGSFYKDDHDHTLFQVVQFEVQFQHDEDEVLVTPLSFKYYPLDSLCRAIIHSVPLLLDRKCLHLERDNQRDG